MKNEREEWYDSTNKVLITLIDVSEAAQTLAAKHLCGPTSAHYMTVLLAQAGLLARDLTQDEETLAIEMKCEGVLGGVNVECTKEGTLRGYPVKKLVPQFDGMGKPIDRLILGKKKIQVTRSIPGKIISQAVAESIEDYFTSSLQRKIEMKVEVVVSDAVEILEARGLMVEALPDSPYINEEKLISGVRNLEVATRSIIKRLGYSNAEFVKATPISFACRCSEERAKATLQALSKEERDNLPPTIDVVCHHCGKIWTINTK